MKKIFLTSTVVATFVGYSLFFNKQNSIADTVVTAPVATNVPTPTIIPVANPRTVVTPIVKPVTIPVQTPVPAPAPVPATPQGRYKNGVYTSAVTDAYYGNVQIKTTISGGNITNIVFLQYPADRSTSRQIAEYSMPILVQEAITAQNANIDGVSGATATSRAFIEALQGTLTRI